MTDEIDERDEPERPPEPEAHDPFSVVEETPAYPSKPARPAQEERTWAAVAHVGGIASSVFLPIVISLVIYLAKKDESPFIADQAKEALNFQVTTALAAVVSFITFFCGIGFVLWIVVALASLVFALIGAIRAYDGVPYRYPVNLRFL